MILDKRGKNMKRFIILVLLVSGLSAGDYEKGWDAVRHSDYKSAISLWKPLAEQGNSQAQSALGSIYCFGDGVQADLKECTYWIKKARENGEDVSKIWNEYKLWKYDH